MYAADFETVTNAVVGVEGLDEVEKSVDRADNAAAEYGREVNAQFGHQSVERGVEESAEVVEIEVVFDVAVLAHLYERVAEIEVDKHVAAVCDFCRIKTHNVVAFRVLRAVVFDERDVEIISRFARIEYVGCTRIRHDQEQIVYHDGTVNAEKRLYPFQSRRHSRVVHIEVFFETHTLLQIFEDRRKDCAHVEFADNVVKTRAAVVRFEQEIEKVVVAEQCAHFCNQIVETVVSEREVLRKLDFLTVESLQPFGAFFTRGRIFEHARVISFSRFDRFGVHRLEFGIVFVCGDFLLCRIIIFENIKHVVETEHPTVRKHTVGIVNTRAVYAVHSVGLRRIVCVFGAERHQILAIPNVNFFARFGGSLLIPVVRIGLAVDDELTVCVRFESDDLRIFGALSVIV